MSKEKKERNEKRKKGKVRPHIYMKIMRAVNSETQLLDCLLRVITTLDALLLKNV